MTDKRCKVSRKTKTSLERWHCGVTGSGMDKNSKGHRKMGDFRGGLLQWRDTAYNRIEQNYHGKLLLGTGFASMTEHYYSK